MSTSYQELVKYFQNHSSVLSGAVATQEQLINAAQVDNDAFTCKSLYRELYKIIVKMHVDGVLTSSDELRDALKILYTQLTKAVKDVPILKEQLPHAFEVFKYVMYITLFQKLTDVPQWYESAKLASDEAQKLKFQHMMFCFLEMVISDVPETIDQSSINGLSILSQQIKTLELLSAACLDEKKQIDTPFINMIKQWLNRLLNELKRLCNIQVDVTPDDTNISTNLLKIIQRFALNDDELIPYLETIRAWLAVGIQTNNQEVCPLKYTKMREKDCYLNYNSFKSIKDFYSSTVLWFSPPNYTEDIAKLERWGESTLKLAVLTANPNEAMRAYLAAYVQVQARVQAWKASWLQVRHMIEDDLRHGIRYIERLDQLDNSLTAAIDKLHCIELTWLDKTASETFLHQKLIEEANIILKKLSLPLVQELTSLTSWLEHGCFAYRLTEGCVAHETRIRIDRNFKASSSYCSANVEIYCANHYTMSDLAIQRLPDIVKAVQRVILPTIFHRYQSGPLQPIENYCSRRLIDLYKIAEKSSNFWIRSQFAGTRGRTDEYSSSCEIGGSSPANPLCFTMEDAENLEIPLPPVPEFPAQPKELLGVDAFLFLHNMHVHEIPFGLHKTPVCHEEIVCLFSGDPTDNGAAIQMHQGIALWEHSLYYVSRREAVLQRQRFYEDMTPKERAHMELLQQAALMKKLCVALLDENEQPKPIYSTFRYELEQVVNYSGWGISETKTRILSILNTDLRFQTFLYCKKFPFDLLQPRPPRQLSANLSLTSQTDLSFFRPRTSQETLDPLRVATTPTLSNKRQIEDID